MLLHTVKVYPSKINLPKKKQLAWKVAEIASDNVKLNKKAIEILKKEGYYIVGVEQVENSTPLQNFQHDKPIAIIFGHEIHGIDQKIVNMCDEIIEIQQFGTKHSLNISVSAGLVIWSLCEKIFLKKNKT